MTTLEAKSLRFFSQRDEAAFFNFLKELACVESVRGEGRSIQINVDRSKMSDDDLRDIFALFSRYNVDLKQLRNIIDEDRHKWALNTNTIWYKGIFL